MVANAKRKDTTGGVFIWSVCQNNIDKSGPSGIFYRFGLVGSEINCVSFRSTHMSLKFCDVCDKTI